MQAEIWEMTNRSHFCDAGSKCSPEWLMNRFLIAFCAEQVMGFWATNGF